MLNIAGLGHGDFRRLLAGAAFNQQGMSGEHVVLGLLVFELTGSSGWVGAVFAIFFLPFFLFGLASGAVADRFDRRALLRRIELLLVLNGLCFAGLTALQGPALLPIIAFTLLSGSLRALHQPARVSYAYDIVGGDLIVPSLGLLNLGARVGQLAGALAAGLLMDVYGAPAAIAVLAAGHGVAFFAFSRLRAAGDSAPVERVAFRQNIRELAGEIKVNRILLMLIAVTAAVEVFGFSFSTALPELAEIRFDIGAEGLGYLHAARAVGGIAAGLGLAFLGNFQRRGLAFIGVIVWFGINIMLLSIDSALAATFAVVALIAVTAAVSDVLTQSMMQLAVPNALRGRAMGVWVLSIGFAPLGHLQMGALAAAIGVSSALMVNGAVLVGLGLAVFLTLPRLRRL